MPDTNCFIDSLDELQIIANDFENYFLVVPLIGKKLYSIKNKRIDWNGLDSNRFFLKQSYLGSLICFSSRLIILNHSLVTTHKRNEGKISE